MAHHMSIKERGLSTETVLCVCLPEVAEPMAVYHLKSKHNGSYKTTGKSLLLIAMFSAEMDATNKEQGSGQRSTAREVACRLQQSRLQSTLQPGIFARN